MTMNKYPKWVEDKKGTVILTYSVGHYEYENEEPGTTPQYEYIFSNGEDSDVFFDTIEEAVAAAETRY